MQPGDAVMVKHYVTGKDALIYLAGPANKQGALLQTISAAATVTTLEVREAVSLRYSI